MKLDWKTSEENPQYAEATEPPWMFTYQATQLHKLHTSMWMLREIA
jgi:hypothetical protein